MKKTFLITVIILTHICNTIHAQKITLAAKGGITIPGLKGSSSDNLFFDSNSFKSGKNFGIFGEYHFNSAFSLSVGVEYLELGGLNKFRTVNHSITDNSYDYGTLYSNFKSDITLNYLSVPVLARYSWKLNKSFRMYAGMGPAINFLMKAGRKISSDTIYLDQNRTIRSPISLQTIVGSDAQALNGMTIGVEGLLGISCRLNKKEAIFAELNAVYGLAHIQQNSANGHTHLFSEIITIGYAFTINESYKNRYHKKFRKY